MPEFGRQAIANSRLVAHDESGVTVRWKDFRKKGRERYRPMTISTDEFIRRFLIHIKTGTLNLNLSSNNSNVGG